VTFDEYLQFLDEYWAIFGPPQAREVPQGDFEDIRL